MSVVLCLPAHLRVSTAASRGRPPTGTRHQNHLPRSTRTKSHQRKEEAAFRETAIAIQNVAFLTQSSTPLKWSTCRYRSSSVRSDEHTSRATKHTYVVYFDPQCRPTTCTAYYIQRMMTKLAGSSKLPRNCPQKNTIRQLCVIKNEPSFGNCLHIDLVRVRQHTKRACQQTTQHER